MCVGRRGGEIFILYLSVRETIFASYHNTPMSCPRPLFLSLPPSPSSITACPSFSSFSYHPLAFTLPRFSVAGGGDGDGAVLLPSSLIALMLVHTLTRPLSSSPARVFSFVSGLIMIACVCVSECVLALVS